MYIFAVPPLLACAAVPDVSNVFVILFGCSTAYNVGQEFHSARSHRSSRLCILILFAKTSTFASRAATRFSSIPNSNTHMKMQKCPAVCGTMKTLTVECTDTQSENKRFPQSGTHISSLIRYTSMYLWACCRSLRCLCLRCLYTCLSLPALLV